MIERRSAKKANSQINSMLRSLLPFRYLVARARGDDRPMKSCPVIAVISFNLYIPRLVSAPRRGDDEEGAAASQLFHSLLSY